MGGGAGRRPLRLMAALAVCAAIAFPQRAEAAGGAFAVDDSEIGNPGECKVESWVSFADNHDFIGAISPACVVALGRPVEIGAQFQRERAGGSWGSGLSLKAKTSLLPVENRPFGLGISGGVSYDLSAGENDAIFLAVPITFQAGAPLRINLNAGWLWDRVAGRHFATWGAGFEVSLKPFTLIGEVFGQDSENPGAQLGIRYTPVEKIDFDLIYGRNLAGEQADWVTLGVNLRF
jgi:hypothetical protein